jgi:hypothetical protein
MRVLKLVAALILLPVLSAVAVATASAAETLWRWLPGAAKTTFTGKTGKNTIQVKGGLSITCAKSKLTGELTEATLQLILDTRENCTAAGLPTNSLGDASGVILEHTETHDCLIKSGDLGILVLLLPLHLEVPSTKLLILEEGGYVALVTGGKGKTFSLSIQQKEGKQAVPNCEAGSSFFRFSAVDGGAFTQAGFEATEGSITFTTVEQETMES